MTKMDCEVNCLSFHDHTPCPEGYIEWHAWAKKMSKTHKQIRCTACDLFVIWIEKPKRDNQRLKEST